MQWAIDLLVFNGSLLHLLCTNDTIYISKQKGSKVKMSDSLIRKKVTQIGPQMLLKRVDLFVFLLICMLNRNQRLGQRLVSTNDDPYFILYTM